MKPLVSAIIPAHGRVSPVLACLNSLSASDYDRLEIIVVDDCSPENISARVAAEFPSVRTVRLPENRGAAGARNEGMRHARGEYFFFVDSDVLVESNTLGLLVEAAAREPACGAIGPVVRYRSSRRTYFVRTRIDLDTGRTYYDRELPREGGVLETHHIPCLWLVARKVVEKVGIMDPIYRTYYEESDWQGRMGRAGFRNLVCLSAAADHDVPDSRGIAGILAGMSAGDPDKAVYHLYHLARNRTIFMKKFAGRLQYLRFLFLYNQLFFLYYSFRLISRSGPAFAGAYLRGFLRGLFDARRVARIVKGTEDRERLPLPPLSGSSPPSSV